MKDAIADVIVRILPRLDELLQEERFQDTSRFEYYINKSARRAYKKTVKRNSRVQCEEDIESCLANPDWHDADEQIFAHITLKQICMTEFSFPSEDVELIEWVFDPDRTEPLNDIERQRLRRIRSRLNGRTSSEFAGRKHTASSSLAPSSEEWAETATRSNIRTRRPPI